MPKYWGKQIFSLESFPEVVFISSKKKLMAFILAQAACVRHPRWRLKCVAGHCYNQLSLFFLLRLLLLTHFGETPEAENLFPPIFWQT